MNAPRIKVCGVCRPEDAALVAGAGADYVGVILAPGRVRSRSVEEAAGIFAAAPGVRRVGVFVDPTVEEVAAAGVRLELDVIQLHGAEPPALLAALRSSVGAALWKAVPVSDARSVASAITAYAPVADALLLDGGTGGRGVAFDWTMVPGRARRSFTLVLAGGLNPENVAGAVRALAPDVVDVSSGVEAAPCCKSEFLVRGFVAAARRAQE